jgi:hypothetical protein
MPIPRRIMKRDCITTIPVMVVNCQQRPCDDLSDLHGGLVRFMPRNTSQRVPAGRSLGHEHPSWLFDAHPAPHHEQGLHRKHMYRTGSKASIELTTTENLSTTTAQRTLTEPCTNTRPACCSTTSKLTCMDVEP